MNRSGDLTTLNTEAIVNSTNEAMTDKTPLTERIFRKAGPQLQQEVRQYIKSKLADSHKVLSKGSFSETVRLICNMEGKSENIPNNNRRQFKKWQNPSSYEALHVVHIQSWN